MKKKMMTVVLAGVMTLSTMACGANTETAKEADTSMTQETGAETSQKTEMKDEGAADNAPKGEDLKIEDIDWSVEESILDGERILSFNYTNNTPYTILDVEMEFKQKEGVSVEQLKAFEEVSEHTDEELSELYILGYNRKIAEPGETVTESPCAVDGTYLWAESMGLYELMDPDMVSIAYIGHDDKAYAKYYDFKTQKYSDSTEGGQDIHEWSESEISSLLPKCEARVVKISDDEDDSFSFKAYGVSREEYQSYVELCKEKGFVDNEYDKSYQASNDDGYEVSIYYDVIEEKMSGRIEKEETEWSDSELSSFLPQPEARSIKVHSDSEDFFYFSAAGVSREMYELYIEECKENGFEPYVETDNTCMLKNEEEYDISISYDDNEESMSGSISAKKESEAGKTE
ncbi:DUF6591 domain-containing protein [Bacteroides acidifaciens]|uniref:DUF6591 domain-containing protein n=1 Tax=Bacteroides acidifaciens TaxID=85831 RepID=UPI002573DC74|nr:DUF6591 domain-containing protein [Bacteroides acidifaciens]